MKPLIVSILLFIPFALGARYFFLCDSLGWCSERAFVLERLSKIPLKGSDLALTEIQYQSGETTAPQRLGGEQELDALATYLKSDSTIHVLISGPYATNEQDQATYFDNLGIARAAVFSQKLAKRGVGEQQLILRSHRAEENDLKLIVQLESDRIHFSDLNTETRQERFVDSTVLLGLQFEPNSTALTPTPELTDYVQELIYQLHDQTGVLITITGHTDNLDLPEFNDTLGLHRAEAVANYFRLLGYSEPIVTESKGEHSPVADNSTEEGRYLNRRVEIKIEAVQED